MQGIEILQKIATKDEHYSSKSVLPSSAEIKHATKNMEFYANLIIPFKHGYLENGGECIKWQPAHIVKAVPKGFGLEETTTQHPVQFHQSIDGAQLTKGTSHLTSGPVVNPSSLR